MPKNADISHVFFEFNYSYYSWNFFKNNINFYSRFYSTNKLAKKLKKLINICWQIYYTLTNLKKANNKKLKS